MKSNLLLNSVRALLQKRFKLLNLHLICRHFRILVSWPIIYTSLFFHANTSYLICSYIQVVAHFMISLIGLGIICLQKTIEYGLYGKFASEQSSTEREGNTINIDSEWISNPFHKLGINLTKNQIIFKCEH